MKSMMEKMSLPEDMPIQHSLISRSIESAQKKVEGHNFDIRKHLVEYDDVANKHRQAIYAKRRNILKGKSVHDEILDLMDDETRSEYQQKYDRTGAETMQQVERMVYLRSIDTMWIEHLNAMDLLRQGIGLRGYGQRDPLVEYKAEAYRLFQKLIQNINGQVVDILLKAEIQPVPQRLTIEQPPRRLQMQGANETAAAGIFENSQDSAQASSSNNPPVTSNSGVQVTVRKKSDSSAAPTSSSSALYHGVGRNELCPCGSGKKFKKCHGR
jgi:preprotein translocase subunit SecA